MSRRAAGLLLHPTCLPGRFGVGDLGPAAHALLDWLVDCGFACWQVLPVGPTGFGDSPYTALSSFAGNELLLSPQALVDDGLLDDDDLHDEAPPSTDALLATKTRRHETAWRRFRDGRSPALEAAWDAFRTDPEVAVWLEDWCLYRALKRAHRGASWLDWPEELRARRPEALVAARRAHAQGIELGRFEQFLFHRQWSALREAAEARGIELMGDLPFYPALDSADVWARPELFALRDDGRPRAVAGVPPDYFSPTGQLWGNPIYRWRTIAGAGFDWWIARIAWQLRRVHSLRLDHFRGFVDFWEIPAGEPARAGRWRRGPGQRIFTALRQALGDLALVAEDLGDIDARVHSLRHALGLPGMRVLQFGFDEVDSLHAPHRIPPDCVVYTGTHDNDTTRGWFDAASAATRRRALDYLGTRPESISEAMVGAALASPAELAILPLQDLLGLGSEARMNRPGSEAGNWSWRVDPTAIPASLPERLRARIAATARRPAA